MENELYHYGVLGMKWGIRKDRRSSTRTSRNRQNRSTDYSEDYKKAHSRKSVKEMSDAELRSRLNRLQMEQQYANLSQSNVNRGKKYFNNVVKVGTTVAAVTTTGLTIYNNIDKIKKIIGSKS